MLTKLARVEEALRSRSKRDYAGARRIYEEVLDTWGPDPDVMWGLAQIDFALSIVTSDLDGSRGQSALSWIRSAIQLNPSKPEYHLVHGTILEHVGGTDYAEAARAYRMAIDLQPMFVPALGQLAALHGLPESVVSLDEATTCCELAVKLNPTRSRWLNLGRLYGLAGREKDRDRAMINAMIEMSETVNVKY